MFSRFPLRKLASTMMLSASLIFVASEGTLAASSNTAVAYPAYASSTIYTAGNRIIFSGKIYEAKWWTQGTSPAVSGEWGVWKEITGETNDSTTDNTDTTNTDTATGDDTATTPDAFTLTQASLDAKEAELTNTDLMRSVKAAIATRDNTVVNAITPRSSANPSNVKRVENIVTESDWEFLFPRRAPEYTYNNFLKAIAKFSAICADYNDGRDADAICRKSLATMFAHFAQETGGHTAWWDVPEWRQALVHVREMGWNETMRGGYNGECLPGTWQADAWPCGTFANGEFKSYFGRGAKQLSYNYNYGPFSEAMFGDVRVLLDHPEQVADTWLNIASAVFFFVYPQPPKPSMLHVIDGTWQPNSRDLANGLTPGFGVTTQIINGGVECGGSVEVQQSVNRISYYRNFANYLGVPIATNEVLGCKGMKQFDATGAGALNIYWEQDWGYVAANPEGKSYACQLVGYQTPYSAFKSGDYSRCVTHFFDVNIDGNATDTETPDETTPGTDDGSNTTPVDTGTDTTPCVSTAYQAAKTYRDGDIVSNAGGFYRCKVGGWCSSAAAWAYAPGTGLYWQEAWQINTTCQ